jgi:predicted 3-demethylubiquinone-9 3-methyltransferase (glyoxalase superfamily)
MLELLLWRKIGQTFNFLKLNVMQKITPFLWFDNQAEEAMNFYCSVFKNSQVGSVTHYNEAGANASGRPRGSVMTTNFQLEGQDFVGLNGGPEFKLNPSVSFIVNHKTPGEVQELWNRLSEGGSVLMPLDKYPFSEKYGWLQDKYGVSWQLILATGEIKQTIIPALMFVGDVCGRAEEAINFYTSVFNNSIVGTVLHYGPGHKPDNEQNVMFGEFKLDGQWFAAMDSAGEHKFAFNESVSFMINCENQEEVDYYWQKLTDAGQESVCGWLKDKFGLSWQVAPIALMRMIADKDPVKAQHVMKAMLQMKKIDLSKLEQAYNQKEELSEA